MNGGTHTLLSPVKKHLSGNLTIIKGAFYCPPHTQYKSAPNPRPRLLALPNILPHSASLSPTWLPSKTPSAIFPSNACHAKCLSPSNTHAFLPSLVTKALPLINAVQIRLYPVSFLFYLPADVLSSFQAPFLPPPSKHYLFLFQSLSQNAEYAVPSSPKPH